MGLESGLNPVKRGPGDEFEKRARPARAPGAGDSPRGGGRGQGRGGRKGREGKDLGNATGQCSTVALYYVPAPGSGCPPGPVSSSKYRTQH